MDDETKKDIMSHFELKEDSSLQVVRLQGVKPNFETGSSQRLSFAKKVEEKKKDHKRTDNVRTKAATKGKIDQKYKQHTKFVNILIEMYCNSS